MSYLTQLHNPYHQTAHFECGRKQVDNYLHRQALADIGCEQEACFVALKKGTTKVKAFYTLSHTSIPPTFIPTKFKRKLPKSFTFLPVTLLGRLAVHGVYQQRGVGEVLLADALKRSYETSKTIGSFAVVVKPVDYLSESFYQKYGFVKLPDSKKMVLMMATIRKLW